jgi:hypothetical protein
MGKSDDNRGSAGSAGSAASAASSASGAPPGSEPPTTSFCWIYGGKEGREVFNLETTISGTLSEAEIDSHIASAIRAMGAVFRLGGRARWTGPTSNRPPKIPASTAPGSQYEWGRSRTGKSVLLLHNDAPEPDEIECPIHAGKTMQRRSNEAGSWLSHKEGDSYCTARIQAISPDS